MSKDKDKFSIKYNSLVTLSILSQEYENSNLGKYLVTEDNLEHSLNFKLCKKPLLEYSDLKESLFYLRKVDECISNYGLSENEALKKNKKENNLSTELGFLSRESIRQNNHFYLQHMVSKKFVCVEKTQDNKFVLKLLKNIDNAATFLLIKINKKRNSKDFLSTKEIFYLALYIKVEEEDLFYYIQDDNNPINKNNKTYYNVIIGKKPITKFLLISQMWNAEDTKSIYSGQLINIIFSFTRENKEEQYMLSVEKKENLYNQIQNFEIVNFISEEEQKEKADNNSEYRVIGVRYCDELCEHVLNNSFWVIEEKLDFVNNSKKPIQIKEHIRIKNLYTGLYLSVYNNYEDDIQDDLKDDDSYSFFENKKYLFKLVPEQTLNNNPFLEYNFLFFNYMLDSNCSEIVDEGKYILKGVFRKFKNSHFNQLENYYKSISIEMTNKNNNLSVKNEDDFIFKIKKIDVNHGNQVIYVKKIISILEEEINKNNLVNNVIINDSIRFFFEYLLNIDYSYRDENYEYNVPIRDRQNLLLKFNIVETVANLIDGYLNIITEDDKFLTENNKDILNELLTNIIKFFKYLSVDNEEIKQTIYIVALNKLLNFAEKIFEDDITILINFIFDLIDNSEALQDYLLGGGGLLKQHMLNNPNLSKYNNNDFLRENKLMEYIEKNHNYLLCYEKFIELNKVQYKRKEIIEHVKKHMEEIKNNYNLYNKNYKQKIEDVVSEVIRLIKKHAILMERFNKGEKPFYDRESAQKSEKKRNHVLFGIKYSDHDEDNKNNNKNEILKTKKTHFNMKSNLFDLSKNVSFTPLLGNVKENNIDINNEKKNIEKNNKFKNIKTLFTYSSTNNIDDNNENNNNNANKNLISEVSDSARLLKESVNIDNKTSKNDEPNVIEPKPTKLLNTNYFSSILKKKTRKLEKKKGEAIDSKGTLKSDKVEDYQKYLNKLGKICVFIKFFTAFDLDNSLFVQDNFLNDIFKEGIKIEEFQNQLYLFYVGNFSQEGKNINIERNFIILYLFHLYNMLFPSIKSEIKTKIREKRPVTGMDIVDEIKNDNDDNNYNDIDEESYKQIMKDDFEKLDQHLCILYSIYQFCINQYVKTIYVLSNITSNYFMNFSSSTILTKFKSCFIDTIKHLLSNVIFMKNEVMEKQYSKLINNPSLLNRRFNSDNLFSNQNDKKMSFINIKKRQKKRQFSNKEAILIEYLFFFENKCDQIKYIYERISTYRYIKNLINDEESEDDSKIEKLVNILRLLNYKKSEILRLHEKLVNLNTKYTLSQNKTTKYIDEDEEDIKEEEIENNNFVIFKVSKRTEIIIKLLRKYELDQFFKNIIYLESQESVPNLITNKLIKKIRKIKEHLFQIENEIQRIKINLGKDINLTETDTKSLNYGEPNQNAFMSLNRHLSQICNESGKLFNLNSLNNKRKDKISQMLSMENKNFYEKIKFIKTFKCLIEAMNYYRGEKDQSILLYCSYLLKIFNDMKNIDNKFHKNIIENYEIYCSLILKSLSIISKYAKDKIGEREQYFFLNICYYDMLGFLLILKSCKKCFEDMKDFMQNVFQEMKIIFNKFQGGKYKIIFQILYTYEVTRVLLFLNKIKTYDSSSYDKFFDLIYPTKEMRENISFCVKTMNNNSKKEHFICRKNSDIFNNRHSDNEEENEAFSLYIPDDENDPLIDRDLKAKIIPMDLSNVMNISESKHSQEKAIVLKEEVKNIKTANIDFIRWENEDELKRLYFYLNFLSVYVIYLNDKNSSLQNEEEFKINENNEKEDFSFNSLSSKIKTLLDSNYNNSNIQEESNNLISSQMENTLIKEEKLYFGEYLGSKNIDYKFHSVLLESILSYRAKFKGKKIEIPIFKTKDQEDNILQKAQSQADDLLLGKENNNIIFYYYSPQYIDIILIEKIVIDIELKKDLMTYCIEDYNYEKNNPPLLETLLEDKKHYKLIENYYDEEFDLIHNHFIKNNMELLIKKILNNYNSDDLNQIEEMGNYIFKRMGEIYSDNVIRTEENSPKSNSLIEEFLSLNEENIKPDLNQINIMTFFKYLVYIYPKFKKSICIVYYKIGFKLLIDKLKKDIQSNDMEEDNSSVYQKFDLETITNILILLFSRTMNKELLEDKKVFPTMLKSIGVFFDYILNKGGGFIFKNIELLKELFHRLDFIFEYLSQSFEKISFFMKKQNIKGENKFKKKKERLKNLLTFLINFLEFKNKIEENLLTEEISNFTSKVIGKIIELLSILLEIPNDRNFEIINILLDFLFNFIKGPDVKNLNSLFSHGYFGLVSFVIKNIDYYNIFLNFIKKDNMHDTIDKLTEIECKIIKIFIIYYNESHGNYTNSVEEFEKLQHWYEKNFKFIRSKFKKLYYMSKKEMEGKEYNINKMLLFIKVNDDYDEFELRSRGGITEINIAKKTENNKKERKFDNKSEYTIIENTNENINENINENLNKKECKKIEEKKYFCIIKFDLLLSYYTLYNYHKDLSKERMKSLISKTVTHKIISFFIDLFMFLLKLVSIIFIIIYYFVKKMSSNKKDDVDLLQELTNIEAKSQLIDDQSMINFLKTYIRELEVTIKNTIYKIYFPMIDKSNTIEQYKEEYYKVEKIDSSDFINYILSNYDEINIRANQYVYINKITNLPVINIFFKKIYVYFILLIILGTISNILIMLSYSIFNDKCNENDENEYSEEYIRLRCPHFLYKMEYKSSSILLTLVIFGFIEFMLQCFIFIDYIVRIFFVEHGICKLKCKLKRLKESKDIKNIDLYTIFYEIILKTMFKCILNFRSFYYILSICFIILGLKIHPFFNCITLLEFVNRIQLMQTVLKAMYKPLKNILITLLMFIIIEYFFSLLAVSFFPTHFPNETDTTTFLKAFMRMMDQTFKQDGGIGTYLDKSLEKGYVPYTLKSYFNVRFFFDLLFFLLILLIIFQMFLSTIIDYFNETRENTEDFQRGLETKCIVCGMEREKIEKLYSHDKNAFDNHTNIYHNAFNYIYYLMYLQSSAKKDPIIEKSIWDIHLKKDLSYLPKKVCFKQNEDRSWKKLNQRKKEEENEN